MGCNSPKEEQHQTPFLNLRDIAGKTPKEVDKVLGASKKLYNVKDRRSGCKGADCPKYSYKGDTVEVVYIKGKADWITINLKKGKWNEEALELLGLPLTQPTGKGTGAIRWEGTIPGFTEVAVFPGQGEIIDYFYIKTATE